MILFVYGNNSCESVTFEFYFFLNTDIKGEKSRIYYKDFKPANQAKSFQRSNKLLKAIFFLTYQNISWPYNNIY